MRARVKIARKSPGMFNSLDALAAMATARGMGIGAMAGGFTGLLTGGSVWSAFMAVLGFFLMIAGQKGLRWTRRQLEDLKD